MRLHVLRGPCPACGAELFISDLTCAGCGTHISGRFRRCAFCSLNQEESEFVKIFLSCRGVLRDVERELGISYPTVRGMLDTALKQLGLEFRNSEEGARETNRAAATAPVDRKEILGRLERKEIGVEEALRLLRGADEKAPT